MKKENDNSTTDKAMQYEPLLCPVCGAKPDVNFESSVKQPFAHYKPMVGMLIYGPYSSEKEVKCQTDEFIHFEFADGENRLVKLGCDFDKMNGEIMPG